MSIFLKRTKENIPIKIESESNDVHVKLLTAQDNVLWYEILIEGTYEYSFSNTGHLKFIFHVPSHSLIQTYEFKQGEIQNLENEISNLEIQRNTVFVAFLITALIIIILLIIYKQIYYYNHPTYDPCAQF